MHRADARDDGTPLEHLPELELGNRDELKDLYSLLEAHYLECLSPEDAAEVEALLTHNVDARAYWARLHGDEHDDDSIREANIQAMLEELRKRLQWLEPLSPVTSPCLAQAMATLHLPERANFQPTDPREQIVSGPPHSIKSASPPPAIAATLVNLTGPPADLQS